MKTFYRICLAAAVVCSLTFAATPAVNALPREEARPAARAESHWLGATLDWLQSLLDRSERPRGQQEDKILLSGEDVEPQHNGSCIDPQGRPRPWCI